jgi:hypothetical protein
LGAHQTGFVCHIRTVFMVIAIGGQHAPAIGI